MLPAGIALVLLWVGTVVQAQVTVNVNASAVVRAVPAAGIGMHTSVYANIFGAANLADEIEESGVQMLRYPGGNYASMYHWTNHTATGGYAASQSHFGNFVSRLLDGSGAKGMVTVNYGSSHQATMGGQPKEAAAWVAYANGDASLYGTPNDIVIGVDAEGNNWRTVGYWARLRGMTPAQNLDNQYDFLAINRDDPVGIEYWEVGNEINGNGYYSDVDSNWNWQYDLHAPNPYGAGRGNHPDLSPAAYANNFNAFAAEMKRIDPSIKVGAVLVGPNGVGDVANPSRNWDAQVLPVAGPNMDFGIIHFYPGGGTNSVLNATDDLPALFNNVRNRINTHVGPGAAENIELHMTEFGYFDTVSSPQIDGVYAANTYATALATGVTSVHWLELSKDSFVGDTPSSLVRGGAYHGIQVFSRIVAEGADFVQTTSSSGNVEVHSTSLPDGRVGLLIANLNASGNSTVNVSIAGADLATSGMSWLYGVNQSTPLETQHASGLGSQFSVVVPARSVMSVLVDAVPGVPGDFSGDGNVDIQDYVLWRMGSSPNGATAEDYELWQSHYAGGSALSTVVVAEPANIVPLAVAVIAAFTCNRGLAARADLSSPADTRVRPEPVTKLNSSLFLPAPREVSQ